MSKDIKSLIRGAKLPERTVPICLRADLVAEIEAAERDLTEAQRAPRDSLAAGSRVRELAERIEALRERMQEHTISFRLRALPRPRWRELIAEHPPRKGEDGSVDERDKYIGVDTSTFYEAMIRACVVEPELDDDDWRILLEDSLTDRQFDELATAAWALNRHEVDIPFSLAASRVIRSSEPE